VPPPAESTASVFADRAGYLQLVDYNGLAAVARKHSLVVHLAVEPGDFVARGAELASLSGSDLVVEAIDSCASSFDLGATRTMQQDAAFGFRQLVDIALKAISPAVNDPSTAATCIDRLGALLAEAARRNPGPLVIRDLGAVRVVAPQPSFAELADLAFNQLRQYGRGDLSVSIRLLQAIERTARASDDPVYLGALQRHADLIQRGLSETFLPEDRKRFVEALEAARASLAPPA
jgi:uncharacterized membrane protein